MHTANNGILIVALLFAFGIHRESDMVTAIAFAIAGISYLQNVADDMGIKTPLFWVAMGLGIAGYLKVTLMLIGGL